MNMSFQRHSLSRRVILRKRRASRLARSFFALCIIALVIRLVVYKTLRKDPPEHVATFSDKNAATVSLAQVKIDWQYPTGPSGEKTAALHSPFHITYGGGERYMLATARALQESGYKTDILVTRDNVCNTTDKLLSIAGGLRIVLDPNLTRLLAVDKFNYHFTTPLPRYVSSRSFF